MEPDQRGEHVPSRWLVPAASRAFDQSGHAPNRSAGRWRIHGVVNDLWADDLARSTRGELMTPDFGAAADPHVARMRRLAALMAPGLDPDDVVQEALLRAWQKRSTYDPNRGAFGTWLLAITADRSRRLRQRHPDYQLSGIDLDRSTTGQHRTMDIDLREAVDALPPRQRQAIVLYYYADLPVAEVATVMACAVGTVKSTLADARSRLATVLGDDDDED